jgi:hypothetical protein
MGDITIEVDGLPVDVDAEEWGADPDGVVAAVRAARVEQRLEPLADDEREPDYREQYGEDA